MSPEARHATRAARERALDAGAESTMDNDEAADVLNHLLETSRDGEYGFRTSAEHAESAEVKSLLSRRAAECATASAELEQAVRQHEGEPADGGTAVGAMHRGWVAVKTAFASMNDKAVLEECERGEDAAVAAYTEMFAPRRILTVPGREILLGGGNVHCITQQVPSGH